MQEIYAKLGQLTTRIQTLAEELARSQPLGTPLDPKSPVYQELMARIKETEAAFQNLDRKAVEHFHAEMKALGITEEGIKKAEAEASAAAKAQAEEAAAKARAAAAPPPPEKVTCIDTMQFEKDHLPDHDALHKAVASLLKQAHAQDHPHGS